MTPQSNSCGSINVGLLSNKKLLSTINEEKFRHETNISQSIMYYRLDLGFHLHYYSDLKVVGVCPIELFEYEPNNINNNNNEQFQKKY